MKITLKKEDLPYIHLFWKKWGATFLVFFPMGLLGRLLLFVFDKIPKAMLIWGATIIIRQVRVTLFETKKNIFKLISPIILAFCSVNMTFNLKLILISRWSRKEVIIEYHGTITFL